MSADDLLALYTRLKLGETLPADRAAPPTLVAPPQRTEPVPVAGSVPSVASPAVEQGATRRRSGSICVRHPKACRSDISEIGITNDKSLHGVPLPLLPPPSGPAARALKSISAGWCRVSEGCIGSDWTPNGLPRALEASLLRAGRATRALRPHSASSCFDLSRESVRAVATCPNGRTPILDGSNRTAATSSSSTSSTTATPRAKPAPIFEGEFGFELLHALPYFHWLHACGALGRTTSCTGTRYTHTLRHQPSAASPPLSCVTNPQLRHQPSAASPPLS